VWYNALEVPAFRSDREKSMSSPGGHDVVSLSVDSADRLRHACSRPVEAIRLVCRV
jgi:hypothetical protein